MQYFQGKSVYKGIVMGPVAVLKKNDYQVKRARIEDSEAEVKRVKEAVEVSKKQLGRLYDKAVREVGEASAAIFEVHQMMLEDEDYLESMENMIRIELVNAEYAAAATGDNFAEMFAAMDDEYMKARSADVKDISERLVRNLSGEGDNDLSSMEPSIIVADDLSPSETVQMDKEKILAFVTVHGSTNSHTAILARMMNIPALIGVPMDLNGLKTGMTAVVDGFSGQVIFEPEEDVRKETEKRMQEEAEKQKLLEELKGKENVTPDGRKINIYANIGSVGDLGYVMENDAGGIGLFRSEFLYLGRNDFPTEEEQFQAYKQAVQTMAGKGFSRLTGRPRQEERLLLTCGVAAGIAATFNAPLAGLLFAGEVLRLDFRPRLLAPCMAAAVAADLVASGAFGLTPIFRFPVQQQLPLSMGWMWLLLGIFLGLLGAFYNRVVEKAQNGYERIGWRPGRLLLPFLAAGLAGLWLPSVLGGGTRLMAVLLGPLPGLGCLLGLLLAKMALSVLCFSSGAPGGLFLPVFSMGALCGGIWAVVAVGLGMSGSWAANCMVLAMAGLFAAVVRAPLTATVLCLEMTGSFDQLLSIAVVCITAWAVTGWLGIQPVYSRLLERLAKPGQNRA